VEASQALLEGLDRTDQSQATCVANAEALSAKCSKINACASSTLQTWLQQMAPARFAPLNKEISKAVAALDAAGGTEISAFASATPPNFKKLVAIANCEPSKVVFQKLSQIRDAKDAFDEFCCSLGGIKIDLVNEPAVDVAITVVGIFSAVQALTRPVPEGSSRADIVGEAKKDLSDNEVVVPEALLLALNQEVKKASPGKSVKG
jgi:hypothetical protein